MSNLNKTPYLIKRMIVEYEKQVHNIEELLRTFENDGYDAAAVDRLEHSTQERLVGMMQLIHAMQMEEECCTGIEFVGIATASNGAPMTYCARAIVDPCSLDFKSWRVRYRMEG